MKIYLAKYGEAFTVPFGLFEVDGVNFRVDAPPAAGDIRRTQNEGAEAPTTNTFADEGTGYSLVLTAAEMSFARIHLFIVDQTGTKVWLDTDIVIMTFGHASSQYPNIGLQTGDSFNRIGVAGIGLSNINLPNQTMDIIGSITGNLSGSVGSVTGLTPSRLDVDVSTRSSQTSVDDVPNNSEFNARTILAANYAINSDIQTLLTRLSALRAGYLDELGPTNVPADLDILIARLSAARAGYLDNLSVGAVALDSTVAKEATKFNPATQAVANVTNVGTTTTNTDMRGTNSVPTNPLLTNDARLNNLDASIAAIPTTPMRGTENAALATALVTHDNNLAVVNGNVNDIETKVDLIPTTAMRGTDGANTVVPDNTGISDIETKIDLLQIDVTKIRGFEAGDWEIVNDQMIFKDEVGAEINRYNLTKLGVPNSTAPDKREKV